MTVGVGVIYYSAKAVKYMNDHVIILYSLMYKLQYAPFYHNLKFRCPRRQLKFAAGTIGVVNKECK